MNSLPHLLNISSLATWLSIAGFGTVAVIVPNPTARPAAQPGVVETQWVTEDFILGGDTLPAAVDPPPTSTPAEPADSLPAPPDMPDLTAQDPLPEIPDPPPTPTTESLEKTPPRPSTRAEASAPAVRRAARGGGKPASSATTTPATGSGQRGGGSGLSNSSRLAAGHMPPPGYPAEARRKGQTGTLVVEFTVDTTGRVISAYAITPSPWPLLNEEAVRTVRRWTFPPGAVMKLQRPIVFQLR